MIGYLLLIFNLVNADESLLRTGVQYLLPDGRLVTPTGIQIEVEPMPMNMLLSPDGKYIYVSSNLWRGRGKLLIIDLKRKKQIKSINIGTLYIGMALYERRNILYLSCGGEDKIIGVKVPEGEKVQEIILPKGSFPIGIYLDFDISEWKPYLYVACNLSNKLLVIDAEEGKVVYEFNVGRYPYDVCVVRHFAFFYAKRVKAYVSNWDGKSVSVIDMEAFKKGKKNFMKTIAVGDHPEHFALSHDLKYLYLTNNHSDTVSVIDTFSDEVIATYSVSLDKELPIGASPTDIAISPNNKEIYVCLSNDNALISISALDGEITGAVPTGWYPVSVVTSKDGEYIYVAHMKSAEAIGKPFGHDNREKSTISIIHKSALSLPVNIKRVAYNNNWYKNYPVDKNILSKFKHVVIVMKETLPYDTLLGKSGIGETDPQYSEYPEWVIKNHITIAKRFTVLSNFYGIALESARGQTYLLTSYVTDYVEKTFPVYYSGGGRVWDTITPHGGKHDGVKYISLPRGTSQANPPGGCIFDLFDRFKISYKSYWPPKGAEKLITDVDVVKKFISDLGKGIFPQVTFFWLPMSHKVAGRKDLTIQALYLNDIAFGMLVEAISNSKYWKETVIFVCKDESGSGGDHVSHYRQYAVVISPYVKKGYVDYTHYSQVSILKTLELIFGLPPLSRNDFTARPFHDCFQSEPLNVEPYKLIKD